MTVRLLKDASISDVRREMTRIFHEGSVDPSVKQLADLAVFSSPDPVIAVHSFVRQTFQYQADPEGAELFIHPRRVAQDYFLGNPRSMDCDDHALLVASMLGALGKQTRILIVGTKSQELDHALAQVNTLLGWVSVDTTDSHPLGWVRKFWQTIVVD